MYCPLTKAPLILEGLAGQPPSGKVWGTEDIVEPIHRRLYRQVPPMKEFLWLFHEQKESISRYHLQQDQYEANRVSLNSKDINTHLRSQWISEKKKRKGVHVQMIP